MLLGPWPLGISVVSAEGGGGGGGADEAQPNRKARLKAKRADLRDNIIHFPNKAIAYLILVKQT